LTGQRPSHLIEIEGLSYSAQGKAILHDINLKADERRIGIVGRNGSGKTTLARLLAGLIAPSEGRLRVAGVDIAADRRAAIRTVGILFQNPDHQIIFPTVGEELGFGLTQLGQGKAQVVAGVQAALTRFGKADWHDLPVHQLSQGQRQLVCLMAVLAMQPSVILLDEPFAGLDIPTRMQLARYLDDVPQTLVQVSHDPGGLAGYDRVIWLDEGRIVQDGPAQEVLAGFAARMQAIGGAL